jgi:hypothetical protein
VDSVIIGLVGCVVLLFSYNLLLQRRVSRLAQEIHNLQSSLNDLDSRADHLQIWSFKLHRWLNKIGGKKFE